MALIGRRARETGGDDQPEDHRGQGAERAAPQGPERRQSQSASTGGRLLTRNLGGAGLAGADLGGGGLGGGGLGGSGLGGGSTQSSGLLRRVTPKGDAGCKGGRDAWYGGGAFLT